MNTIDELKQYGVLSVKNPRYGSDGVIVCDVVFSDDPEKTYGFAASETDPIKYGRLIYKGCVDGIFGDIVPRPKEVQDLIDRGELISKYNDLMDTSNSNINNLKVELDEIVYGLIEDTTPSVKERIKTWVAFRRKLNSLNLDEININDLPELPE